MKQDIGPPLFVLTPVGYLFAGTLLLGLAAGFAAYLDEGPVAFFVLSMVTVGPALYLLITGAVARGIQVARSQGEL